MASPCLRMRVVLLALSGSLALTAVNGFVSTPASAAGLVPGRATIVSATPLDTGARICWTPAPNGSTATDVYQVWLSIGSGWIFSGTAVGGLSTCATIGGLTNAQTYALSLTAHNSDGWGPQSGDVQGAWVTPAPPPTVPGPPRISTGDTTALLSWDQPAGAATGFQVSVNGTVTTLANVTSYLVTGLVNGVANSFAVQATNSIGISGWSEVVQGTSAGRPFAGTKPSATAGNGQASLTWTPAASNGAALTGQSIQWSKDGGSNWVTVAVDAIATRYVQAGLPNNVAVLFRVAASNSVGTGTWSPISDPVTPMAPTASAPPAPSVPGATPAHTSPLSVNANPARSATSVFTSMRYRGRVAELRLRPWAVATSTEYRFRRGLGEWSPWRELASGSRRIAVAGSGPISGVTIQVVGPAGVNRNAPITVLLQRLPGKSAKALPVITTVVWQDGAGAAIGLSSLGRQVSYRLGVAKWQPLKSTWLLLPASSPRIVFRTGKGRLAVSIGASGVSWSMR